MDAMSVILPPDGRQDDDFLTLAMTFILGFVLVRGLFRSRISC